MDVCAWWTRHYSGATVSGPRPFVLVVNPRAAAGRALTRLPALESALREAGGEFEVRQTRGPRDATRIVRQALNEGAAGIAVMGGDGTFSEAACGFFDEDGVPADTDAWLGLLPCGTGGDFSRTLGIRDDPVGSARRMLEIEPRPIDCGWIKYVSHEGTPTGRAFLNIASFGAAGLVDKYANEGPKWIGGTPAFLLATVRALARYRAKTVRVTVDGAEPEVHAVTNVAVANGRYFGGGMHIAPEAAIDDGVLDIVTILATPLVNQARYGHRMYDGTVLSVPFVEHRRGRRIVAESVDDDEVLLDVDGEAPGRLPATLEIHPGVLRLRA